MQTLNLDTAKVWIFYLLCQGGWNNVLFLFLPVGPQQRPLALTNTSCFPICSSSPHPEHLTPPSRLTSTSPSCDFVLLFFYVLWHKLEKTKCLSALRLGRLARRCSSYPLSAAAVAATHHRRRPSALRGRSPAGAHYRRAWSRLSASRLICCIPQIREEGGGVWGEDQGG